MHAQHAQEEGQPAWFAAFVQTRDAANKLVREEVAKNHAEAISALQRHYDETHKAQQKEIDALKQRSVPDSPLPFSTPTTKTSFASSKAIPSETRGSSQPAGECMSVRIENTGLKLH